MPSRKSWSKALQVLLATLSPFSQSYAQEYQLGVGIGDVTGPVVETNMMGYADLSQTDTGLHMRQFSRAFIIAAPGSNSDKDRILFINSDLQSGDTAIRRGVLEQLNKLYPGLYTENNVALVGTHSHAGVGGFLNTLLPTLTSLGFVNQTYSAIVTGTVLAVKRAHESLAPGTLSVGNVTVLDTNLNRSPYAYEANPAEERAKYQYDQDKELHLLKFLDKSGTARGFLSFFAVHGTSLYQNNTLVSTDNKGMAAYLYEADVQPDAAPGKNTFVAGFVQSNVGDTTPNTLGAFCESPGKPWDGQPCEYKKSTCGNVTQGCHGRGPGFHISDFESNRIIGENQYLGAKKLMNDNGLVSVKGSVRSLHTYVNMSNYTFPLANGTTVHTCPPAMGYSFAGGTSDGPGAFDFTQGQTADGTQNPFWEVAKGIVTAPASNEQNRCHYPKPILLNTGYTKFPYAWQPDIVDIQMMRVGQFVVLVVPGEESVRAKLISSGIIGNDAYVVLGTPKNLTPRPGCKRVNPFSQLARQTRIRITLPPVRSMGSNGMRVPPRFMDRVSVTLEAYQNLYTGLVEYLADGATAAPLTGPIPEDLTKKAISLQTGVVFDAAPIGKSFGSVLTDVTTSSAYKAGETVVATFQAANPRNNLRLEGTFLTIDCLVNGAWTTRRTDSHPSTKFRWTRTNTVLGHSTVQIEWVIEPNTPAGTYRITYYGDSKPLIGSISSFTGRSNNFTITA
ncbi:hypothetical protein CTheo_3780 [Ceratobasidium theobromae]|uniref:Neutral ceramidase n=1 Tax=Ceratobasidium theobromae TaxID=1582974 RepID=A0A5N5QNS4_9AGAM|nr:hypothetical protein CTheo_3780 [Ceratobasidium theobromae]